MGKQPSVRTQSYDASPCKVYGVVAMLCCCYFGKYFCTSNMYVVKAKFQDDAQISDSQMATFFSVGYFFSMFGKASAGAMADTIGGYKVILLSVFGYATATLLFSFLPSGSFSFYGFLATWAVIGYCALGLAWVAIVAVATNWIPKHVLGRLMGIVSMAPQLGDVLARLVLSNFLGWGWRAVFQIASGVAFLLLLPVLAFVRNAPGGEEEEEETHQAVVKDTKDAQSYMQRLMPLVKTPLFWVLCLLSGSLYGTRTLFLLYSNNFLAASYCFEAHPNDRPESKAYRGCLTDERTSSVTAAASSIYTLLGCVSVLLVGVLKDKLPEKHRAATLVLFIIPLLCTMVFLGTSGTHIPFPVAVAAVAFTGFCLFGPYKVLGAVFAVDVGGKRLKSTCTAFMGVFDNMFAIFMLQAKGVIGEDWILMFASVAGLCVMSVFCSSFVWVWDLRKARVSAREPIEASLLGESDASQRRNAFNENRDRP